MGYEGKDMMLYLESAIELMWKPVEMIYMKSKMLEKKGKDWNHRPGGDKMVKLKKEEEEDGT